MFGINQMQNGLRLLTICDYLQQTIFLRFMFQIQMEKRMEQEHHGWYEYTDVLPYIAKALFIEQ